jgi:hypothetical protein
MNLENKKYYVLDNIISKRELLLLYNNLISDNIWYLTRSTDGISQVGQWPGFIVSSNEQINNYFWFGRFLGILDNIKNNFEKKYNFSLPPKISRIHIGAKNNTSNTDFHCDVIEPFTYTIVGYLTPEWNKEWGGELNIEGEKIDFTPGRFIIFKSDLRHDGSKVKKEIDFWKVSLNYVLKE